jgi:hypothetical protein
MKIVRRYGQEFSEPSRPVDTDDLKPCAAIGLAHPARIAGPATYERFDDNTLRRLETRDTGPNPCDHAGDLMPSDSGIAGIRIFPLINVQVPSTDPDGSH